MGWRDPRFLKMAYTSQAEIETLIPGPHLVDALDDDRDGAADAGLLATILTQASNAVDSYLAGIYTVPFVDPIPPVCKESGCVFACEMVYARRGVPADENPFTKRANFWRDRLEKIGKGEIPLDAGQVRLVTPGAAVTEPMATEGSTA